MIFLRKIFEPFKKTFIHPQWFAYRCQEESFRRLTEYFCASEIRQVIDIGCADKVLQKTLANDCEYLGLDYYVTASELYSTMPDVFGDAQTLPFATESIECVTLMDVLEHLPNPEECISEVARVLKNNGTFVIQVPFMYPIHDSPYDFQRWTVFGLKSLLEKYSFSIIEEDFSGNPAETAALVGNIALSKIVLNMIKNFNPLGVVLLLYAAIALPLRNLLSWLISKCGSDDVMMPHSYRFICRKVV